MTFLKRNFQKGFTLTELLTVMLIITLLSVAVVASVQTARSRSRDAQVKSDKQRIVLALVKAREKDTNYAYPPTSVWVCLKATGSTCYKGVYSGDTFIFDKIKVFFSGQSVPSTPAQSDAYFYDSYLYNSNVTPPLGTVAGAYLWWYQEKPILQSECNGVLGTRVEEPNVHYCYELLPR